VVECEIWKKNQEVKPSTSTLSLIAIAYQRSSYIGYRISEPTTVPKKQNKKLISRWDSERELSFLRADAVIVLERTQRNAGLPNSVK